MGGPAPGPTAPDSAGAEGLCALEAGTGLIIAGGTWTGHRDFACHIHYGTTAAAIDWEAAIAALDAGDLPCSGGEKRMLRLAASLAADIPVCLGDAVTGIDRRSVGLLLDAILRVPARSRQFTCDSDSGARRLRTKPATRAAAA